MYGFERAAEELLLSPFRVVAIPEPPKRSDDKVPSRFVHGYNGEQGTLMRSAAETALNLGPISPTGRPEPDER